MCVRACHSTSEGARANERANLSLTKQYNACVRQVKCSHRVCQDGVRYLLPYMSKQILHLTPKQLLTLVQQRHIQAEAFAQEDEELLLRIKKLAAGSVVCNTLSHMFLLCMYSPIHAPTR